MAAEDEVGSEEAIEAQDLYYVSKSALEGIQSLLKEGKKDEAALKPLMDKIIDPTNVPDEEMMLPVDMRGVGQDFESVEDIVEALGVVGAAEAFVKAREYFDANKEAEPEDERPKPMTAAEWKKVLEEEDLGLEGEEEELLEDDEEEADEDAEEAEEPPAKKAKTD
mmetsp:Transcript_89024/g.251262  ORF Transcript_89024/g.251262 Transcript_89024/m.251262 type:complete len:166 (+) Transcript_89024:62-559(+)|eukprot:CAMPEP_0177173996 /NCGR_PEP_ID=MMETSP0367-20130122/11945_1 /TAXON_ID=447022 ORGANISM="Scrippsiella hangoei-like, Strain SHHI-4" /NCGR_SAMPLE_ID=MMETSP0367 /ASSEMBLY_ACC=CAM_ASM_000362 /LENGTH=165 /DNA_ID=CAMNT_0018620329 /DNA_START=43 /DNA_END=540 /DNA_ORIENTATION=-